MARAVFKRGLSINQTKPSMGREDTPKLTDLVEMYDWPKKGTSGTIRATGPVQGRGLHKINVMKKDGSKTEITKVCLSYNVDTDEFDHDAECPYCNMPEGYQARKKRYFLNVIDRRIEEDAPAKIKKTAEETKTGFKDMASNSWTPARVLGIPSSVATRLVQLSEKNVVKNKEGQKKTFDFNHDRYGFDMDISFDKSASAATMYSCDRNTEERFTPMGEEQLDYLLWDLDIIYEPEDIDQARREAKSLTDRWRKATGDGDDAADDEDEDTDRHQRSKPAKRDAKPAKRGRQEESYDDDDAESDDDAELDLEGEEDYDEPPARSRKPAPKRGKRDADIEEEGEEEDDGLEEEGEDEYADSDDFSGDAEGEDEDEDFDQPAPKRGAKPAKRGRQEEADEGDDDFEDEPAPKRKPAAAPQRKPQGNKPPQRGAKPQGKPAPKRKPASDDLDDLDDDVPF